MNVGNRIKTRRIELGFTVDEIAKKLNKNRATIYRYESNEIENMPISVLEPLAKILQTTPAYLMGWEDLTPEPEETIEPEPGGVIAAHFDGEMTDEDLNAINAFIKGYLEGKKKKEGDK